jgi:quercetin dioxygenase-like cupin family protein
MAFRARRAASIGSWNNASMAQMKLSLLGAAIQAFSELAYVATPPRSGATSGKPDANVIPAGSFTLTVMAVPPGQGNAAHTHEVEEVFFVLRGHLTVFLEDETGRRIETVLGPWDCISCPAGIIHGYQNNTVEMVYLNVMVGKAQPELMGYTDPDLFRRRARGSRRAPRRSV